MYWADLKKSHICHIWGQSDPIWLSNLKSLVNWRSCNSGIRISDSKPDTLVIEISHLSLDSKDEIYWHPARELSYPLTTDEPGIYGLAPIIGQIQDFSDQISVHFARRAKINWNLIGKNPGFVPFPGRSDQLWFQIRHPVHSLCPPPPPPPTFPHITTLGMQLQLKIALGNKFSFFNIFVLHK